MTTLNRALNEFPDCLKVRRRSIPTVSIPTQRRPSPVLSLSLPVTYADRYEDLCFSLSPFLPPFF